MRPFEEILAIDSAAAFDCAALELFRFQAERCGVYREYLAEIGVDPAAVRRVDEIPMLPIEFFKWRDVYCGDTEPQIVFTSSNTGQSVASHHMMASTALYEAAFTAAFERFYGNPARWSLYGLLPNYLQREGSSLVYMVDRLIGRCGSGGFYLDDYERLLADMAADPKPKIYAKRSASTGSTPNTAWPNSRRRPTPTAAAVSARRAGCASRCATSTTPSAACCPTSGAASTSSTWRTVSRAPSFRRRTWGASRPTDRSASKDVSTTATSGAATCWYNNRKIRMKVVAFVPIRLNSQRVEGKNLRLLGGEPLLCHILRTLLEVEAIDEVYVYCSDPAVRPYLPDGVRFLRRSPRLDRNETLGREIYDAFTAEVVADVYLLAHATSPFIRPATIAAVLHKVTDEGYDSAFSAERMQTFAWYRGEPLNYALDAIPRTQEIEPVFVETSAFFIFRREIWCDLHQRIGRHPYVAVVDRIEGIDIDYPEDFALAEVIAKLPNR